MCLIFAWQTFGVTWAAVTRSLRILMIDYWVVSALAVFDADEVWRCWGCAVMFKLARSASIIQARVCCQAQRIQLNSHCARLLGFVLELLHSSKWSFTAYRALRFASFRKPAEGPRSEDFQCGVWWSWCGPPAAQMYLKEVPEETRPF